MFTSCIISKKRYFFLICLPALSKYNENLWIFCTGTTYIISLLGIPCCPCSGCCFCLPQAFLNSQLALGRPKYWYRVLRTYFIYQNITMGWIQLVNIVRTASIFMREHLFEAPGTIIACFKATFLCLGDLSTLASCPAIGWPSTTKLQWEDIVI